MTGLLILKLTEFSTKFTNDTILSVIAVQQTISIFYIWKYFNSIPCYMETEGSTKCKLNYQVKCYATSPDAIRLVKEGTYQQKNCVNYVIFNVR